MGGSPGSLAVAAPMSPALMTVPRAGMAVPVLEPRCSPALALAWRLWQRLSPSPFMASMSSTDDARRRLRRLSRDRRSWDRLLARLWLAKASARRSARGDDCVTGGSGSPISAASSSGRSPSPGSSEDEASSGPESLPGRAGSMASGSTTPGSTTTTSGGSGGSDWRLPVSASSFSRRDRLRPGGKDRTGVRAGLGLRVRIQLQIPTMVLLQPQDQPHPGSQGWVGGRVWPLPWCCPLSPCALQQHLGHGVSRTRADTRHGGTEPIPPAGTQEEGVTQCPCPPVPAGPQGAGVTQWLVLGVGASPGSGSLTASKLRMNMMTAPSSFFTGTTSTRHGKELPAGGGSGHGGMAPPPGKAPLPGPKHPGRHCPCPCWAPPPGEHPLLPPHSS